MWYKLLFSGVYSNSILVHRTYPWRNKRTVWRLALPALYIWLAPCTCHETLAVRRIGPTSPSLQGREKGEKFGDFLVPIIYFTITVWYKTIYDTLLYDTLLYYTVILYYHILYSTLLYSPIVDFRCARRSFANDIEYIYIYIIFIYYDILSSACYDILSSASGAPEDREAHDVRPRLVDHPRGLKRLRSDIYIYIYTCVYIYI